MDSDTVKPNEQEWRKTIERYYPRVRAWFARVLTDPSAVEDLTQEVFVRLCARLAKGEVMLNPWNFIKVIAKNVFMEHLRARKRRRAVQAMDGVMPPDRQPQPADVLGSQEVYAAIPQLLLHLDEEDRYIVFGRYSLGMTLRELAEAIGVSASTVVDRHHRALCELRKLALSRGISL